MVIVVIVTDQHKMESDYVKRTVGSALALGLAEVATIRPTDPVEYLAIWLLKHKVNLEEKQLMVSQGIFLILYKMHFVLISRLLLQKIWDQ